MNRAEFVKEAVESVIKQDYQNVEHIIMDGGSTDDTLDILHRYPSLKVLSQPDNGIYDALNKGIRLAQGEVLGFLNTDDFYAQEILGEIALSFKDHPKIDALVGKANILSIKTNGKWGVLMNFETVPPGKLLFRVTQGAPIFNAWFFRRYLFEEIGLFDTRYRYVADRDFLIRMALADREYANLDRFFYHYRMHPGSVTLSGQDSGEDDYMFETRELAQRYARLNSLDPRQKKYFKTWHSQIVAEEIVTAWRKRGFLRIFRYIWVGFQNNPIQWPVILFQKLIERFTVFLKSLSNS